MIHLKTRSILEISGSDAKNFLQGLITNDINKVSDSALLYSAMLNAQGRFLYDFFIFTKDDKIFLDCLDVRRDEIFKKLNFYKLKAKVTIAKNDEYAVVASFDDNSAGNLFSDPRHVKMGYRGYLKDVQADENEQAYHFRRISLAIPESEFDLTYEKSIIAEFGFDDLNAVDYKKGCYIGQELTARTHYMGQVRKKIFHVKMQNLKEIEKNYEISCEGKSAGIILSSVFYKNQLHALALLKFEEIDLEKCEVNGSFIEIMSYRVT